MVEEIVSGSIVQTLQEIWRRRKWLLIAAFLSVFVVTAAIIQALPSLYRASTTILVGVDDIEDSLVTAATGDRLTQRLEVVQQAILSRSRLLEVIERMDLYPELREVAPEVAVIAQMRKDIQFERPLQTQDLRGVTNAFPLTISYQTWDPELAAQVANELASLYKDENEKLRTAQASNTTAFLKEQLDQARHTLEAQQALVNDFTSSHIGELPQQEGVNLATLERLNNQLSFNSQQQMQLMALNEALLSSPRQQQVLSAGRGASLSSLRLQLADLRELYTDEYPAVQRLVKQIESMEASGAREDDSAAPLGRTPEQIAAQIAQLREEEVSVRAAIDDLQRRIVYSPTIDSQLQKLTSDYRTAQENYFGLQKRYQDARLSESLQMQKEQQFQVLEPAIPPVTSAEPQRMQLMVMSLVLAVGFASALVFVVEQLDNTFHTPQDIRRFTNLPILGSISRIQTTTDRFRFSLRATLYTVGFVVTLGVLAILFYNLGESAKGIVWMMAGRGGG